MLQDLRQSEEWSLYMQKIGWEVEVIRENKAYIRKIPLLGSIIKIPRPNPPLPYLEIDKVAKKHKALLVKIEPNESHTGSGILDLVGELRVNGFYPDNWAFAPTKTIRISLGKSLEEVLSRMEKETRYSIRKAQEQNLESRIMNQEEGLEEFITIYKQTAKRAGFWVGPEKELRLRWEVFQKSGKADLFLSIKGEKLMAGAMVFYHNKAAFYYHAASTLEGRKIGAPSLVVWEIIKTAKQKGFDLVDLEGIKDVRIPSTKNWEGFSNFKRSFGGEEVEFVGSFSKYYLPIIGSVFRLIQKLGL